MPRDIRISPDGQAVAIKTDRNPDGNQAWGVIHFEHGCCPRQLIGSRCLLLR